MLKCTTPFAALLALALVACGSSSAPSSSAPEPAVEVAPPPATSITGTIAVRVEGATEAPTLSPDARLELSLVDISQRPALPVANKVIKPVGALPLEFKLDFRPSDIVQEDFYEISARIVDGERHYTMPLSYPVLTQGRSANAEIVLSPEPTASEKLLADFESLKAGIGGMEIKNGSQLMESESHGWQVFRKDGELKFIIDVAEFTDGGRTQTDYAYNNGKPYVVVRQYMADKSAPVDHTDRAGWSASGEAVLAERSAGNQATPLSEAAVSALYKDAEAMFKRAGGNKF